MKIFTYLGVPFATCDHLPDEARMDCFIQAARNYSHAEVADFLKAPRDEPFAIRGTRFLLLCSDEAVRPTLYVTASTVQRNPTLAELAAAKAQGGMVVPGAQKPQGG